ncbi:MAG: hypothetical protein KDA05_06295 [Phycisphaerales bacterium]|nr:hypothetical protein [Phycisphaerales bacterium]MCB9840840.1 hypothetical protein [Phycisphaeraceae bacterium]
MKLNFVLAATTMAAFAGLAQAATFSFASDTNHTDFTFAGFGSNVSDANDPTDPVTLLVDDTNGPLPALEFDVEFDADFEIGYVSSVMVAPGIFTHNYSLNGSFAFSNLSGTILTVNITDGALIALGGQASWGSTDTILGSDNPGSVEYIWSGGDLPAYGVFNGTSVGIDDASFTLTFLQSAMASGVGLGTDMLPNDEWQSEGSYSGTAFFVPAPGATALLGLSALVAARRRR